MESSDDDKFLGMSFNFFSRDDERDLNASLHRELFLLHSYIMGYCESVFNWEGIDRDERDEYEPRLTTWVWMDLWGMSGQFPRKDNPKNSRMFYLQIGYGADIFSFTVFEDITEDTMEALERYQAVAEAEVEVSKLGFTARKNYRPQVGGVEKGQ